VGYFLAGLVLDYYSVAGGAGIAAGAAVAVGDEVVGGRGGGVWAFREKRFGAGGTRIGHPVEFTTAVNVSTGEQKNL
jgi:hypothetical protein